MPTPGDPPMRAFDRRHGLRRHVRIVAGEMHQERARAAASLVEMLVDLHAVVARRSLDGQARAREIGELAAEAEAHHADLAGAVRAPAQGLRHVPEVAGELVGVEPRAHSARALARPSSV